MSIKILVFREKHDNLYYDASNRDAYLSACLEVVKKRVADKWHYFTWNPDEVKKPDVDIEILRTLPDSPTKTKLLDEWKTYEKNIQETEAQNHIVHLAEVAAETGDYYLAWHVLTERQEHEYEGFDTDILEAPLGIQSIDDRNKMKPSFKKEEAISMIQRRLRSDNIAKVERLSRLFKNKLKETIQVGSVTFPPGNGIYGERAVPLAELSMAEADPRLEKCAPDIDSIRLWNLESIQCLDSDDMIFSYWLNPREKEMVRPTLSHVYQDGSLKLLNITNFMRVTK